MRLLTHTYTIEQLNSRHVQWMLLKIVTHHSEAGHLQGEIILIILLILYHLLLIVLCRHIVDHQPQIEAFISPCLILLVQDIREAKRYLLIARIDLISCSKMKQSKLRTSNNLSKCWRLIMIMSKVWRIYNKAERMNHRIQRLTILIMEILWIKNNIHQLGTQD